MVDYTDTKLPFKHHQNADEQEEFRRLWAKYQKQISSPEGWTFFKRDIMEGKHGPDAKAKWSVFKEMRRCVMNRRCTEKTHMKGKKRLRDVEGELEETKKKLRHAMIELSALKAELATYKSKLPAVIFVD